MPSSFRKRLHRKYRNACIGSCYSDGCSVSLVPPNGAQNLLLCGDKYADRYRDQIRRDQKRCDCIACCIENCDRASVCVVEMKRGAFDIAYAVEQLSAGLGDTLEIQQGMQMLDQCPTRHRIAALLVFDYSRALIQLKELQVNRKRYEVERSGCRLALSIAECGKTVYVRDLW